MMTTTTNTERETADPPSRNERAKIPVRRDRLSRVESWNGRRWVIRIGRTPEATLVGPTHLINHQPTFKDWLILVELTQLPNFKFVVLFLRGIQVRLRQPRGVQYLVGYRYLVV
eukprot:scaffold140685_cov49-Attheya_sp.AAC.2